jgi:oligopeptidase B
MKKYIIIGALLMNSCSELINEPRAKKESHKIEKHNDVRVDNYYWMRLTDEQKSKKVLDQQSQNVMDYIKAENDYTIESLKHTEPLQSKIFNEIVSRIKKDDNSVPYYKNGYFYYTRYEKGKEYEIYCRKKNNLKNPEEVILDGNILSKNTNYFSIDSLHVSPDNKWIAYGIDTLGRRFYSIFFKNLETGETLNYSIPNTEGDLAWANDNKTIFYTKKNRVTLLSEKICRHQIGDDPSKDYIVYEEKDNEYYNGVYRSKSGEYIIIWSSSTLVSDYHILPANNPKGEFSQFTPRGTNHEYAIEHYNDKFYIITNLKAKNNRLMETPTFNTHIDNWVEIVPHRDEVQILDLDVFENHLVINERIDGLSQIRIFNHRDGKDNYLKFNDDVYTSYLSINKEINTNILRYVFTSLTEPLSTYDYNMDTGETKLLKKQEIIGGYESKNYKSIRLIGTSRDGNKIPISLVYKKDLRKLGAQNLLLYAYGSYGSTIDPYFSLPRLSLLDRGFIFAIAHVRGSQIYGRKSYEDGKLLNKKNSFNDFIDAAKFLINKKYTKKENLFCSGGSAGGLLIGSVINMEPTLWKGAIASVPFVDVVTTMLDPSIPLTSNEWDEWGDPRIKEHYYYMLSYSPYDLVSNKQYPNMLVTTGFYDSQVQYWEPLKWVAKLREHWESSNKLYLKVNMDAGHSGQSGRFRPYKETALEYAFLINLADEKQLK